MTELASSDPFGRALAASGGVGSFELEFEGVETVNTLASVASILGCVFIIVTYVLFQPIRKYHPATIIWIALLGLLYHVAVLAETQSFGPCKTAVVTQIGLVGQDMYFIVLAFRFFYSTKYPFRSTKLLMPLSHLFVLLLLVGLTYWSSNLGANTMYPYGICWFGTIGDHNKLALFLILMVPLAVGYVVSIGLYFAATKRVRVGSRNQLTNLDIMRRYLLCMFGYWCAIALIYILRQPQVTPLDSTFEKSIRFVGRMLFTLKGFISAVTWSSLLHTRTAFKLWRKGNWDEYIEIYDATWVQRQQTVYYATKGIQYSTQLATEEPFESAPTRSFARQFFKARQTDQKAVFRDFHPSLFQEIRQLSGISNEDYAKSFRGRAKERFSEGKSGSFLYYTGDQQFILKTCSPGEQRYLLRILPQYIAHLRKYPNSYICRYIGCHELVVDGRSVTFIVLTNMLTNPNMNIDEFYDLKGSWVGRYRAPPRDGSQRVCTYCGRDYIVGMSDEVCERNPIYGQGHTELSTGKDMDWGDRRLRLPPGLSQQLGKQLYEDSEFLRRINSMDYSLIIGMARSPSSTINLDDDGVIQAMHLKPPGQYGLKDERPVMEPDDIDTDEVVHLDDTTYVLASSPTASRSRELVPNACVTALVSRV
ncbi:hypothetical protein Poli38472_002078 [Pythium oligandrum]|uniref:PIPK domain-containing protein n=1 Tax=Pythium oligandrum TaxID=41045 RepID=A0A8K1FKS8_PYTOL|nr:hypothetical protein Poli38472_002078 [Pythium oligandrum]|eukprot:TMW63137.1 hypothetical protein Poli38472_002078 [Pythium oligandrum]